MRSYSRKSEHLARCQPHLGTFVKVLASANTPSSAIAEAFARIAMIDRLMSPHGAGLDIERIRHARPGSSVELATSTAEVIRLASKVTVLSHAAFDPTRTKPRSRRLKFTWLDDFTIRIDTPGLLDLGGIAKGYAVDQALAVLKESCADWGLVNAGGDAAVFGKRQRFLLRNPEHPEATVGSLELDEGAVASSSPQFTTRRIGDKIEHHLYDGAADIFGPIGRSATVVAQCCAIADALTKVVYFRGAEATPTLKALDAQGWWWESATGWQECT